jgi:hypothetical protein
LAEINSVEQEPIPDFTLPRTADGDTEPPVARELRQLPPRNITPTPSWLDAVVEEER